MLQTKVGLPLEGLTFLIPHYDITHKLAPPKDRSISLPVSGPDCPVPRSWGLPVECWGSTHREPCFPQMMAWNDDFTATSWGHEYLLASVLIYLRSREQLSHTRQLGQNIYMYKSHGKISLSFTSCLISTTDGFWNLSLSILQGERLKI